MRVLCLRDNPAQQWTDLRQSVMDRLKSENGALIKRLRELESSGVVTAEPGAPRGEELVPRESWEVLQKEKEGLEEVVKQKEKRLLRLQQVCHPLCFVPDNRHGPSAGLYSQKHRVPGSHRVDSRTQAGVLPKWTSEGDVDLRSLCVVCLPAAEQNGGQRGWCADATGGAGRRRAPGPAAVDALLGGGGGVHTGVPCERDVGVLRPVEAGGCMIATVFQYGP